MRRLFPLFALFAGASAHGAGGLAKDIVLSDWGVKSADEIGWVQVGVLRKPGSEELIVYDVRARPPAVPAPPPGRRGRIPRFDGDVFVVGHFDRGNINRLGGYFSAFNRAPSLGAVTLDTAADGTPALAFSYVHAAGTWAGFWIHLYNFKAPPAEQVFLDASPFTHLTFAVRGERGGEALRLQIADRGWESREDSLPVGDVGAFLPRGRIDGEWQRAWVPLERIPDRVDRRELASIVFLATSHSEGRVLLKDLAFTRRAGVEIPGAAAAKAAARPLSLAMWLWETKKILDDPKEIAALAAFCREERLTDLFVQIPYEAKQRDGTWSITWDAAAMRPMIAAVRAAGTAVHALDGHPRYALRHEHGRLLTLIDRIARYNRESRPEERFAGIRYDNEPYLLPQFGGVHKEEILLQYLDLLKASKSAASRAGLEFGADIPFWFDSRNEYFEWTAQVGGRPMSERIIDAVDNVGIMDYRTMAYGADGVIEHAVAELSYASRVGKKVFIGLETVELPDEDIYKFSRAGKGPSRLLVAETGPGKGRLLLFREGVLPPGHAPDAARLLGEVRVTHVPASKITFARKRPADLRAVMEQATAELLNFPAFVGYALHSYESYRPWKARAAPIPVPAP